MIEGAIERLSIEWDRASSDLALKAAAFDRLAANEEAIAARAKTIGNQAGVAVRLARAATARGIAVEARERAGKAA